jgi:hypothetical protein
LNPRHDFQESAERREVYAAVRVARTAGQLLDLPAAMFHRPHDLVAVPAVVLPPFIRCAVVRFQSLVPLLSRLRFTARRPTKAAVSLRALALALQRRKNASRDVW